MSLAVVSWVGACGDDIEIEQGQFGDDEIGTQFFDYDFGPGPLEGTECLTNGKEGAYGYVAQCGGFFAMYIEWIYDGGNHNIFVPTQDSALFGDGYEPYDDPKVMACCAPYDQEKPLDEQQQFILSCQADARQQACRSMALALEKYIDETLSGAHADAMEEVKSFLDDQSGCMSAFAEGYPGNNLVQFSHTWTLPEEASSDPDLAIVEFTLSVQIFDVFQPEDPSTCESMHENGATFFEEQLPPYGSSHAMTLVDGGATLVGPTMAGYGFPQSGVFSSYMEGCQGSGCSSLELSIDPGGGLAVHEMRLALNEDITITSGLHSMKIIDPHLELYGPALGGWRVADGERSYSIGRGADFLVVGETDTGTVVLHAKGATPMTMTHVDDEWFLDTFRVQTIDGTPDTWTLVVQPTEWLSN